MGDNNCCANRYTIPHPVRPEAEELNPILAVTIYLKLTPCEHVTLYIWSNQKPGAAPQPLRFILSHSSYCARRYTKAATVRRSPRS
jgi:hypothetical protein